MTRQHTHRNDPKRERGPYGFLHCVNPSRCNPASHGGVYYVEVCRCGASRSVNSTGFGRHEVGPWSTESED